MSFLKHVDIFKGESCARKDVIVRIANYRSNYQNTNRRRYMLIEAIAYTTKYIALS